MSGKPGMTVLHICSAFAQQDVYAQLVRHLERKNVRQFVFAAVRSSEEADRQPDDSDGRIQYRFRHMLRPWHRVFFRAKIAAARSRLESDFEPGSVSLVHAHFLYSDGAVAMQLNAAHSLPYVVAVRNTDVNYFHRFRPDLRGIVYEVLARAASVVFLTPAYRADFLQKLPARIRGEVERKSVVLPNGVAPYWLESSPGSEAKVKPPLRLLYVGDFSRNKNVAGTIRAARILASRQRVELTLVGGGGDGDRVISEMIASGEYPFVNHLGRIDDREKLREVYRANDMFVMPSFRETFGVAYVEALSQGLPIVHSRGQGMDGFIEDTRISEAVNPHEPEEIAAGIARLETHLGEARDACIEQAQIFDWGDIANRYIELYRRTVD